MLNGYASNKTWKPTSNIQPSIISVFTRPPVLLFASKIVGEYPYFSKFIAAINPGLLLVTAYSFYFVLNISNKNIDFSEATSMPTERSSCLDSEDIISFQTEIPNFKSSAET